MKIQVRLEMSSVGGFARLTFAVPPGAEESWVNPYRLSSSDIQSGGKVRRMDGG